MANPYTTAIFEKDGTLFQGCASYNRSESDDPWFAFLLKDGKWYTSLGSFGRVEDAWTAAKQLLGIDENVGLPRSDGDSTDGGPFTPNDATHVR